MTVFNPTWESLKVIVESAHDSLLVCSPFYSDDGIGRIFNDLRSGLVFDLVTRLSPSDWVTGISDPESVLSMLEIYADSGTTANLYIHPRLHAKAYIADKCRGFLGSANLSSGGFQRNFELMVNLTGEQAIATDKLIRTEIDSIARIVNVHDLKIWIEQSREIIENAKSNIPDNDSALTGVQRSLDVMLGYGIRSRRRVQYAPDEMGQFVEWLRHNQSLPGAVVLLEHHENIKGGNRTGHFKQCFFIVSFFYEDNQDLCAQASGELNGLDEYNSMNFGNDFVDSWVDHITEHALDQGDYFNYSTLRAIISPSWGGTLLSGGGAIGTLKRMLRLLARYIQEKA